MERLSTCGVLSALASDFYLVIFSSTTMDQASSTDAEKNTRDGESEDTREYPSGIAKALILGPVTLTYFLLFLDLAVLSTATPAITSDFKSLVDVGW